MVTAHYVVTSSAEAFEKLTSALFYQGFGSVEMALRLLGEATAIDPEFGLAWVYQAVMLGSVSRDEEAFHAAVKAYQLRDRFNERQRLQAELYYHHFRGDLEQALQMHQKLVAEFPAEAALHRSAAHAHSILGYTDEAIREARLAIDLEPGVSSGYMILASSQAQAGRFQEALATLDSGRSGMPDSPLFYFEESSVRLLMDDETAALAVLRRVESDSDGEIRNIGKGRRLICQLIFGKLDEARASLELEATPDSKTLYWRGLLYLLEGRNKDAVHAAEALSSRSAEPFNMTALRSAATLAAELGDSRLAKRVLEKSRTIDERYPSSYASALRRYAEGLSHQVSGNAPAAEKALSEARHLRPDILSSWTLARFFENHGSSDRAFPLYKSVVENESLAVQWDQSIIWVRSLLHAGRCCEALGKTAEAAKFLNLYALHWDADRTRRDVL